MTVLLLAVLLVAAPALAAPAVDVQLAQTFRARAQLPPLSPIELSKLGRSPDLAAAAKLEAARAFLAGINPNFDATITPESRHLESGELLEIKRDVAAARQALVEARLDVARDSLLTEGRVDPDKLDAVFNGSKRLAREAAVLQGSAGKVMQDLILDGAPRQALGWLESLVKENRRLAKGPRKQAVATLRRDLALAPVSRPVREFQRRLSDAKQLLKNGLFGEALVASRALMDAVMATPAREGTKRALWVDASEVETAARRRGAPSIYGTHGRATAAELAFRARALPYKGDRPSPAPTRVQCYGDCAVQQAYNHPRLAPAAEVVPYHLFLDGAVGLLGSDVRADGMGDIDTTTLLRELGLKTVFRRAQTEAQLLEALDAHGALITSIRWQPAKSPLAERRGDHAVLVRGAFLEDGEWKFVVIDSNYPRPQVMPYRDLLVLGVRRFDSVEPMLERELPPHLRGLPDLESRVRAGAARLRDEWAPLGRRKPWWRRLLAWLARE